MPRQEKVQIVFAGVQSNMAEHVVGNNEVVSATNIDFSAELGAASVRRGSSQLIKVAGESTPVYRLKRAYQQGLASSLFFARIGTTVYAGASTLSLIQNGLTGDSINDANMGFSTYREDAFLGLTKVAANVAASVDTAGTARDWVLTKPANKCTVATDVLANLEMTNGTWADKRVLLYLLLQMQL